MSQWERLSREQLYAQVWAEPMSKLARRYGLSDVGLKKVCKKHDIPTPGLGYWAKVQAGQTPPKAKLPKAKADRPVVIRPGSANRNPVPKPKPAPRAALEGYRELEARPDKRIVVKQEARNLHPLARELRKALKAATPNHYGALESQRGSLVKVHVSPASALRAVLLVDALLRAAGKRGFKEAPVERHAYYQRPERAALLIEGERVSFRLSEKSTRSPHQPTREEQRLAREKPWHRMPSYDYTFTGLLSLDMVYGSSYPSSFRIFRDKQGAPLEDRLNEVMVALYEFVDFCRAQEAERREQARLEAEARQRRLEAEARQAEFKRREELEARHVQKLLADAAAYRQAQELRAYLAAVRWVTQPLAASAGRALGGLAGLGGGAGRGPQPAGT